MTRSELARRVWGERVVTDSSFSTLVAELRKALGDDGRRQTVIRTLGSGGYRFVALVRVEGAAASRHGMASSRDDPFTECVRDGPHPHVASLGAAAHHIADRSLETALTDGPRHLEVAGVHCDAFVHDWACTARDRGIAVHRADCLDAAAPPLWAWWQIAASILEAIDADEPGAATRSLRALWHRVRVEIASMAHEGRPGGLADARQRRFILCHDLSRALLRTARRGPCAITLEGARGVDADAARLLRFVLSRMDRSPLWIVTSSPMPGGSGMFEPACAWPRSDRIRLQDESSSAARARAVCGCCGAPRSGGSR